MHYLHELVTRKKNVAVEICRDAGSKRSNDANAAVAIIWRDVMRDFIQRTGIYQLNDFSH